MATDAAVDVHESLADMLRADMLRAEIGTHGVRPQRERHLPSDPQVL